MTSPLMLIKDCVCVCVCLCLCLCLVNSPLMLSLGFISFANLGEGVPGVINCNSIFRLWACITVNVSLKILCDLYTLIVKNII